MFYKLILGETIICGRYSYENTMRIVQNCWRYDYQRVLLSFFSYEYGPNYQERKISKEMFEADIKVTYKCMITIYLNKLNAKNK